MKSSEWFLLTKQYIKEKGLWFVVSEIERAVEECAMPKEDFEKLLIKSIIEERENTPKEFSDFSKKIQGKVFISNLAVKKYGLQLKKFRCACPFHEGENETSLLFNDKTNTFRCWSCGEHGNIVHFVKLMEELKNAK